MKKRENDNHHKEVEKNKKELFTYEKRKWENYLDHCLCSEDEM